MRILLICQQSPHRYDLPAYNFWAHYFRAGLREGGHEALEVPGADWARGLLALPATDHAAWRSDIWSRTVAAATEACAGGGLDLVLSYLYPQQIDGSAVRAVQRLGVPCVNFFCDHLREFRRVPEAFGVFDLNWVPEHAALSWYRDRGWRALSAAMPCWVAPERRQPPRSERDVVSFIGRRDPLRSELLEFVARSHLPLEVRGPGWLKTDAKEGLAPPPATWSARCRDWGSFVRRQGWLAAWNRARKRTRAQAAEFDFSAFARPSPSDDDYQDMLAGSAVSVGVNRFPSFQHPHRRPATYSRLRDIEAPMLGACYLTEWAEGIDQLFEPDREIALYRSEAELVEQARNLLANSARRMQLRIAGQRRALADHTIPVTLERLRRELGL
jgi:hypothetical protein